MLREISTAIYTDTTGIDVFDIVSAFYLNNKLVCTITFSTDIVTENPFHTFTIEFNVRGEDIAHQFELRLEDTSAYSIPLSESLLFTHNSTVEEIIRYIIDGNTQITKKSARMMKAY